MEMDDALKKHVHVFSTILICLCYCYYISTRIPKGVFRLISILPILLLFTILPLYLPRACFSIFLILVIIFLANGKLILLALGQGPLLLPKTLLSFITSGAFPIQNPSSKLPSKSTRNPRALAIQILAYAILTGVITEYGQNTHPKLRTLRYAPFWAFFLFLYMDFISICSEFASRTLFGIEIEAVFDEPYLSTSLHNFWGRRWNLMVSNMLREVVYKPVRYASALLLGDDLASVPAYLATFLVSGLFHELMLFSFTRAAPSWKTTAFFVVHGICMVLESRLKKALKGRLNLPRLVSMLLTIGFVVFTADWLFLPPLISGGVEVSVITELRSLRGFCQNGIASLITWATGT